jgi:hypothetical protein
VRRQAHYEHTSKARGRGGGVSVCGECVWRGEKEEEEEEEEEEETAQLS